MAQRVAPPTLRSPLHDAPAAARAPCASPSPLAASRRSVLRLSFASLCLLPLPASASPLCAVEPGRAGGASSFAQYDEFASDYDSLDGGPLADALGLPALRRALLAAARGDVLEVACGTGLSLPFYPLSPERTTERGLSSRFEVDRRVTSLTLVDLSGGMLAAAAARAERLGLCADERGAASSGGPRRARVRLVRGDATALPFGDASFDTVVDTFSFCVLGDVLSLAALAEMRRVLRPGGRALLLEHSSAGWQPLDAYQRLTSGVVASVGGKGCKWDQDVVALVARAGFDVAEQRPAWGGTLRSLVATPRAAAA